MLCRFLVEMGGIRGNRGGGNRGGNRGEGGGGEKRYEKKINEEKEVGGN